MLNGKFHVDPEILSPWSRDFEVTRGQEVIWSEDNPSHDVPCGRPLDPNLTYPYDIRYFGNLFQDFLSGQQYAIPPSVLITGLVGANRNQFNESDRF